MKLNRIASVFIAVLLVVPTLFAAENLTGKWSGSFIVSMNGLVENESAYMELKQAGKELTGTAGPSVDRQWPILKGTVLVSGQAPKETTKVSFEVQAAGDGAGPMLHFELELVDGHLKGNAKAEQNGMAMTAVLDLTRVK